MVYYKSQMWRRRNTTSLRGAIPYFIGQIPQMYFPTIMNYEL